MADSALPKSMWRLMDTGSKIAAAAAAPRVSRIAFRALAGHDEPKNLRHPDVSTKEALLAAAIGGALVEITRVAIRRAATTYWVRSTGELPPGMKKR